MINMDGQFLSYLKISYLFYGPPISLTYDFNMNCIWIGYKYKNTINAYRYITQETALTGKYEYLSYTISFILLYICIKCKFIENVN